MYDINRVILTCLVILIRSKKVRISNIVLTTFLGELFYTVLSTVSLFR